MSVKKIDTFKEAKNANMLKNSEISILARLWHDKKVKNSVTIEIYTYA